MSLESQNHHPRQYAAAIAKHSLRSQENYLHPGTNYQSLNFFLSSKRADSFNGRKDRTIPPPRFDFVSVHDLCKLPDDPERVTNFDSVDGISAFIKHPLPVKQTGQLVFVRGHPSKEWINAIGARLRVNPELFRRQLSFPPLSNMFDLPSLPSSLPNTVKLPISSLGIRQSTTCSQSHAMTIMQRYWEKLGTSAGIVGESIVRHFHSHDKETFSIEQEVTVSLVKKGDGWIAMILLDMGRDLNHGPDGPWFTTSGVQNSLINVFRPTFLFQPRMCFLPNEKLGPFGADTTNDFNSCCQSATLLSSSLYGRLLDPEIMQWDCFYAMHELFKFALYSENQFLNCMRAQLESDHWSVREGRGLSEKLQNYIYHRDMLHRRIECLKTFQKSLEERGGPRWPSLKSKNALATRNDGADFRSERQSSFDTISNQPVSAFVLINKQLAMVEAADASLMQDCSSLLWKAENLVLLFKERIDDIRTTTSVLETQRAFQQTATMGRLTFLAFMFIPLSFTTSFFGMNFKELGSGPDGTELSIWIWVVVTIPVFASALIVLNWSYIMSFYKVRRIFNDG